MPFNPYKLKRSMAQPLTNQEIWAREIRGHHHVRDKPLQIRSSNAQPSPARMSFKDIIKDKTFTFIIGPDGQRYNIHVAALKAISEPLGFMMTNGKMEESIKGEAILKDVEPVIFEQLVQFAYLGLSGIYDGVSGEPASLGALFYCVYCGAPKSDFAHYPWCSDHHRVSYSSARTTLSTGTTSLKTYCIVCGIDKLYTSSSQASYCTAHDQSPYHQQFSSAEKLKTSQSQSQFQSVASFVPLTYGAAGLSHQELSNLLNNHIGHKNTSKRYSGTDPAAQPSTFVVQNAKVYVLAQKYMVKDLQDIALHKVHRSLAAFKIEDEAIDELIDLVLLAYSETPDGGDILHNTTDKLRHLVMMYVAHNSRKLLAYESFRSMISAGGAQTADFFALKYAKGEY